MKECTSSSRDKLYTFVLEYLHQLQRRDWKTSISRDKLNTFVLEYSICKEKIGLVLNQQAVIHN